MCTQYIITAATGGINYSECLKYSRAELKKVLQLQKSFLSRKHNPKLEIDLGKGPAIFGFVFHLMSRTPSSWALSRTLFNDLVHLSYKSEQLSSITIPQILCNLDLGGCFHNTRSLFKLKEWVKQFWLRSLVWVIFQLSGEFDFPSHQVWESGFFGELPKFWLEYSTVNSQVAHLQGLENTSVPLKGTSKLFNCQCCLTLFNFKV